MWQSLASFPVAGFQGRPPVVAPERHAPAVEPGVRIGGRGVRVVAPPLAVEVALGVAPTARVARRRSIAAFRLGLEALHASEGLDQRAIDREVLVREQRPDRGLAQHRLEQPRGDVPVEQPVAVLREHRDVPDRIFDAEADEPAEQQVVLKLLHQLALRAHRVERLQKKRTQELLGRDRGSADRRVQRRERGRERGEGSIHQGQNAPQRVVLRHPPLTTYVGEQRLCSNVATPHRRIPHLVAPLPSPTRSGQSSHLFPQPASVLSR